MKPLNRNILSYKRELLSSTFNITNQNPIKCHKINKPQILSPITLTKRFPIPIEYEFKTKKTKSKDEKGIITPLSTRQHKPVIKCNTKRTEANYLRLINDNVSIDIDMSKSFTKVNDCPKGGQLPLATMSNCLMASNNNSIVRNDYISNYLNYNLGDTKNYTHLDEIALDKDEERCKDKEEEKKLIEEDDYNDNNNHTPSTNEMEIDLSKASINFDSLLIGAKLSFQAQNYNSKKNNTNIFSNNSVYYLDTIECEEHEKRNQIKTLNIKDNATNFHPTYCLTEANYSNNPSLSNHLPKNNRNIKYTTHQTTINDSDHYKLIQISINKNIIKSNRTCYLPQKKYIQLNH